MYSVKNVKTGPSREYGPNGSYTCNLYKGNKKIASVFEAGDGGCLRVYWEGDLTSVVTRYGHEFKATQNEVEFENFAKTQTYVCEYSGETETYDAGMYIAKLADDYLTNKKIRGWCRTQTVIRLKGDAEGEFRTFKCKYSPRIKVQVEAKFGDKLLEIVNERFVRVA